MAILLSIALLFVWVGSGSAAAQEKTHWGQAYVQQLDSRYPVSETVRDYNFNDYISVPDMKRLLKCVMDLNIELSSASRQEVVSKLVDVYAAKTGLKLDEVLFVALVPFEDFDQISPEYTRNIMYAYSSGLLKGRGNSLMAPADRLSYAEAFVLVSRLESMAAEDSFYVQGEVVKQESSLKFNFKLVNRSGRQQNLTFASSQLYELVVSDRAGQEVYRYSDQMMFTQVITPLTIGSGESIPAQVVWDMRDGDGALLPPGRYNVHLTFMPLESSDPHNSTLSSVLSFNI